MISGNKLISVQNRNFGGTSYIIPDLNNLHRDFQPNEIKQITFDELFKLSQTPGGEYIIQNYLIIHDEAAVNAILNGEVEPEYFYTEKDIEDLLLNKDPDYLEDCLNFAPQGVIDLVKSMAVKLEVPDTRKRKLILEKTGFSVDNALHVNEVLNEEEEKKPEVKAERKVKRTAEDKSDAKPARKIVIPKE